MAVPETEVPLPPPLGSEAVTLTVIDSSKSSVIEVAKPPDDVLPVVRPPGPDLPDIILSYAAAFAPNLAKASLVADCWDNNRVWLSVCL